MQVADSIPGPAQDPSCPGLLAPKRTYYLRFTGPDFLPVPVPGRQAVDERPQKLFSIHTPWAALLQARDRFREKDFFYPQVFAQAVHKQGALVYSLSTGWPRAVLVPDRSGDNVAGY